MHPSLLLLSSFSPPSPLLLASFSPLLLLASSSLPPLLLLSSSSPPSLLLSSSFQSTPTTVLSRADLGDACLGLRLARACATSFLSPDAALAARATHCTARHQPRP
eukprot:216851-Rhodomonas_salina.2